MLTMDPKTFNYLFITFHEFRLSPGKDTDKRFVSLALSTIKKNLGEQVIDHVSIDEIIEDFNKTVKDFVEKKFECNRTTVLCQFEKGFCCSGSRIVILRRYRRGYRGSGNEIKGNRK